MGCPRIIQFLASLRVCESCRSYKLKKENGGDIGSKVLKNHITLYIYIQFINQSTVTPKKNAEKVRKGI
jgi:hypothetical protein